MDAIETKKVAPLGIYSQDGRWYLYATDISKDEERSYRLDRIQGEIKRTAKSFQGKAFTLPKSHFPNVEAIVSIRRDHAPELQSAAEVISEDDDWLTCKITFKSENDAVSKILKYSPNVILREPVSLVSTVTKTLNELVKLHG
jgi:proteasome accessory factor B